jgi:hypothetical protein
MNAGFAFSEKESFGDNAEKLAWLRKYGDEYLLVRPYFMEDFYPLTKVSDQLDVWSASQFNRPEEGDGIIQLFRREESAYETACFKLRGLDPDTDYSIMDLDGDFTITLDGETQNHNALLITGVLGGEFAAGSVDGQLVLVGDHLSELSHTFFLGIVQNTHLDQCHNKNPPEFGCAAKGYGNRSVIKNYYTIK